MSTFKRNLDLFLFSNHFMRRMRDWYHFLVPFVGAFIFGTPSNKLIVIGVTGTKGKSSTTEILNAIFEEAGYKTALLNSIRVKIADESEPNFMRMSMPGRFYIQAFLAKAVRTECSIAIIEMTSEGARQHRHRAISMNGLIFTNLAPEHIESHGSLQEYADTKFEIARQLARSEKRPRIVVANADDPESVRYLALSVEMKLPFSLAAYVPYASDERGGTFHFEDTDISIALPGEFSLRNAIAAALMARAFDVNTSAIASALGKITFIPGRAERIEEGQDFAVVVDYAHTPDSLTALYDAYKDVRKVCVLGATGGGRDIWKRPVMGRIADERCDTVILTDEDPYDEEPLSIVEAVAHGMQRTPEIIMDRREAIARALTYARTGDAVLITGKGTDPCICVAGGEKILWSDAHVAREEIGKLLEARQQTV